LATLEVNNIINTLEPILKTNKDLLSNNNNYNKNAPIILKKMKLNLNRLEKIIKFKKNLNQNNKIKLEKLKEKYVKYVKNLEKSIGKFNINSNNESNILQSKGNKISINNF
tara:strand:+ start:198 stop:530 length:333 start_codon:yes stop_codon:yes gene_type:complete